MMDGHKWTACFEAPGGNPVLKVYPDPKTRNAPWTVGLGHTGRDVCEGDEWTPERCWHAFYNDYSYASGNAVTVVGTSCWATLNEPRRAVLTDMSFNLGPFGLSKFHKMLAAIRVGDWQKAHDELLNSEYAKDVGRRATKNADVLLTGEWVWS